MLPHKFGFVRYDAPAEGGAANSGSDAGTEAPSIDAGWNRIADLGLTPDDVEAALDDYARYLKTQKEAPKETPKETPKAKVVPNISEAKAAELRAELLSLYPELAEMSNLKDLIKGVEKLTNETQELRSVTYADTQEAARKDVFTYVRDTLQADVESAAGRQFLSTVLDLVNDKLSANPDALEKFVKGDKRAIRDVLSSMNKSGLFKQFSYPKATRRQTPYLESGGGSAEIQSIVEANKEKYSKAPRGRVFAEISRDIHDQVFGRKDQ